MKCHLQCAEQQVSPSNLTKYCTCHEERLACLILVTSETSFTMRRATDVTIQPHQTLHLPRKVTRYSTLLYSTLLYSTLLYFTLLYFTLLYSTLLYSTLLYSTYSTLLYSTLLYSTLLYSTLLYLLYSTLLYFTLLYSTYSTLLYSTWLYSTLLYLLYSTYSTLLTLLYFTLLYFTLLYFTLLCDVVRISEVSQLNFLWLLHVKLRLLPQSVEARSTRTINITWSFCREVPGCA